MLTIRCDKELEKTLESFVQTMKIQAKITESDMYDICLIRNNDSAIIHNIATNSIVIANGDSHDLVMSLGECRNTVITCGFSGICTVTLSSVTDEDFVMCIQRNITNIYGECIMPQEIPVKQIFPETYNAMFMYTLALVCGKKPDKLILEGR